jgi:hypothetical protein
MEIGLAVVRALNEDQDRGGTKRTVELTLPVPNLEKGMNALVVGRIERDHRSVRFDGLVERARVLLQ